MRITAAVAEEPLRPFTVQTLELDAPQPNEILVRVISAGVCHTDLSIRDHNFPPLLPAVLGHEGAGIVEDVGSRVTKVRPGDSVVMTFASCGRCRPCRRGSPAYCTRFFMLNCSGVRDDGSQVFQAAAGADSPAIKGRFFGQSSFATYALADERNVVKVPKDTPLDIVGPLGCSVQTGAGAVMNSLRVPAGSSIAVFGVGAVGMSAIMAARLVGCSTILAVDINRERLSLAESFGATHVVHVAEGSSVKPVQEITDITRGGADFSIEATGIPAVLRQAVDCLSNRGVCGVVGLAPYGAEVSLDITSIVSGRTITGILEGDSVPEVFIPTLLDLHRQGKLPFDRLIRHYSLEDINQAATDMQSGATIKPVLRIGS